jgi:hypothetical protein
MKSFKIVLWIFILSNCYLKEVETLNKSFYIDMFSTSSYLIYKDLYMKQQFLSKVLQSKAFRLNYKKIISNYIYYQFFIDLNILNKTQDFFLKINNSKILFSGSSFFIQINHLEKKTNKNIPCEKEGCKVKIFASGKTKKSSFSSDNSTKDQKIISYPSENSSLNENLQGIRKTLLKSPYNESLDNTLEKKMLELQNQKEIEKLKDNVYREKEFQRDFLKLNFQDK